MRISICVTLSALFASYNALPITDTMLQTRTAGHNYGKATYCERNTSSILYPWKDHSDKRASWSDNLATGNQVACGGYFYDSENVCAANPATYAGGNHCGKMVTIRHGDKSATCRLVDGQYSPSLSSELPPVSEFGIEVDCLKYHTYQNVRDAVAAAWTCHPPCLQSLEILTLEFSMSVFSWTFDARSRLFAMTDLNLYGNQLQTQITWSMH